MDLYRKIEKRDPEEFLPAELPDPIRFENHRNFVRETLAREVDLRARGTAFVPSGQESPATIEYRDRLNSRGSPSEMIATDYTWAPGTEIRTEADSNTLA